MARTSRFGPEVIVINADGEFLGRMPTLKAMELAREQSLELIEVNKQKGVSVCKIMDRGKWKYEQKKKHRKIHTPQQFKEMKFGLRIHEHDEQTKLKHISKFLSKGLSVKIVVEMRGRERQHPESAEGKMNSLLQKFQGQIKSESIRKSNANVSVMIYPVHKKEEHASEKESQHRSNTKHNRVAG